MSYDHLTIKFWLRVPKLKKVAENIRTSLMSRNLYHKDDHKKLFSGSRFLKRKNILMFWTTFFGFSYPQNNFYRKMIVR